MFLAEYLNQGTAFKSSKQSYGRTHAWVNLWN